MRSRDCGPELKLSSTVGPHHTGNKALAHWTNSDIKLLHCFSCWVEGVFKCGANGSWHVQLYAAVSTTLHMLVRGASLCSAAKFCHGGGTCLLRTNSLDRVLQTQKSWNSECELPDTRILQCFHRTLTPSLFCLLVSISPKSEIRPRQAPRHLALYVQVNPEHCRGTRSSPARRAPAPASCPSPKALGGGLPPPRARPAGAPSSRTTFASQPPARLREAEGLAVTSR